MTSSTKTEYRRALLAVPLCTVASVSIFSLIAYVIGYVVSPALSRNHEAFLSHAALGVSFLIFAGCALALYGAWCMFQSLMTDRRDLLALEAIVSTA